MNKNMRVACSLFAALVFHIIIGVILYNVFKPEPVRKERVPETAAAETEKNEPVRTPSDSEEFVIAPPDNRAGSVRPKKSRSVTSATGKPRTRNDGRESAKTHTVQPGESYWVIARKYGVSIESLMDGNGLDTRHVLQIGEKLKIPN